MEEEFRRIGNRIKDMRKARNITQKQLAQALDVSLTNMSNIETGKTAVTMQNLVKLKGIFSCEMKDFFMEEVEQKLEIKKEQDAATSDTLNEIHVAPAQKSEGQQSEAKLPESIDLQDAINLLRLLRRIDIKGI